MRPGRFLIILTCLIPLALSGDAAIAQAFSVDDMVDVEWKGKWYGAKVLKAESARYFIHYDNHSSSWDEWVGPARIRKPSGKSIAVKTKQFGRTNRPKGQASKPFILNGRGLHHALDEEPIYLNELFEAEAVMVSSGIAPKDEKARYRFKATLILKRNDATPDRTLEVTVPTGLIITPMPKTRETPLLVCRDVSVVWKKGQSTQRIDDIPVAATQKREHYASSAGPIRLTKAKPYQLLMLLDDRITDPLLRQFAVWKVSGSVVPRMFARIFKDAKMLSADQVDLAFKVAANARDGWSVFEKKLIADERARRFLLAKRRRILVLDGGEWTRGWLIEQRDGRYLVTDTDQWYGEPKVQGYWFNPDEVFDRQQLIKGRDAMIARAKNDVNAQVALGLRYRKSDSLMFDQNFEQALRYFRLAEAAGNVEGVFRVGEMYYEGNGGVKQDFAQAMRRFRLAGAKGHHGAEGYIGAMYLRGEHVAKDQAEALRWIEKAAKAHDPQARYLWGRMHAHTKHRKVAQASIQFAAKKGWPPAVAYVDDQKRAGTWLLVTGIALSTLTEEELKYQADTYDYMAPEQREGGEITPAVDVYAFGLIVYRLLTGKRPTLRMKSPSRVVSGLNDAWDDLIFTCVEDEPGDRFADGRALSEALDRVRCGVSDTRTVNPVADESAANVTEKDDGGEEVVAKSARKESPRPSALRKDESEKKAVREKEEKPGKKPGETWSSSLGMKFAWIPPGKFTMGSSPFLETDQKSDEVTHSVTLTRGFYMGVTTVTQQQWKAVMGMPPIMSELNDVPTGDEFPAMPVSYDEALNFLKKLNQMDKDHNYRLPTEAEWEYACRAGTDTAYSFGNEDFSLLVYATFTNVSGFPEVKSASRVATNKPNPWGLYDMHGNVWEWCSDWYGDYPSGDAVDPTGPANGNDHVLRGGCWNSSAADCRSARRESASRGAMMTSLPGATPNSTGFRCVVEVPGWN